VTVNEVNAAPQISLPGSLTIDSGTPVTFTVTATDSDLPAQFLTFSLDPGAPATASIDPASGAFAWTPDDTSIGTNVLSVRVTDSGSPTLSAAGQVTVIVQVALHLNITRTAETVTISINSVSGATYRAEYKNDLDGAWQLLEQKPASDNTLSFSDSVTQDTQRFYHVIRQN